MAYRPTDRTRARAAAARERIVSAALEQLAEGGYASASMAAVARRAGVATGSVYRHFPSPPFRSLTPTSPRPRSSAASRRRFSARSPAAKPMRTSWRPHSPTSSCPPWESHMLLNRSSDVLNQSVPFEDVDLLAADVPLQEALERDGAGWAVDRVRDCGLVAGSAEAQAHGRRAERNEPRLLTHDRFGHRIDQVELDPSWHWLLRGAVEREIHALPWREERPGA